METLLPIDPQLARFDDEKLLRLLAHPSGIVRCRALPTLGPRMATAPLVKAALLAAAADPANLSLAFYAHLKVAWIAAMTVLDHGNAADLLLLKAVVSQWPAGEQNGFLAYIKEYRGFGELMRETAG